MDNLSATRQDRLVEGCGNWEQGGSLVNQRSHLPDRERPVSHGQQD